MGWFGLGTRLSKGKKSNTKNSYLMEKCMDQGPEEKMEMDDEERRRWK